MLRARARQLWPPLAAFAVSRVVVLIALYFAPVLRPGYNRRLFFFDWDAAHYLFIAQHGYPPLYPPGGGFRAEAAFFPLLPWLTRWFALLTPLTMKQSAFVVVNATAVGAVVALWWLARDTIGSERGGTRTVVLASFWPASFVLSMMYNEALLILFGALCLLALRRQRWLLAGLAALVASAARPNGIALALPCAWCALVAIRSTRSLRPLLAPVLAPLGMLGYFVFLQVRLHNFFLWFDAEKKGWPGGFDFGRHFVVDIVIEAVKHPTLRADLVLSAVAGIGGLALLAWAIADKLPIEQLLYAAAVLIIALGAGFGASIPRYVLDAFPLFIVPARRLDDERITLWTATSASLLTAMTLVAAITRVLTP